MDIGHVPVAGRHTFADTTFNGNNLIITGINKAIPGINITGGKGHNLLLLQQAGYPVPGFIIIPTTFFDGISTQSSESQAQAIAELLPKIKEYFKEQTRFAVRSSAVAEDGNNYSFAGQFTTVLNVEQEELANAITTVWKSAESVAASYLQHASEQHIQMAVIVQEMIPATVSGVAFGMNPLTGNREEIVINAIYGLGEELVSGHTNADNYIVKNTGTTKEIIGTQPVLNDEQLKTVAYTVTKLGALFNRPQDIEFSFKDDVFYLLQSRPVTNVNTTQERIVWDNSNIIESYPELTLTLTFSFIEKMYAAVYRQLSVVLGVSKAKVDKYATVYDNMLGLLNGRVYYNLNSWYAALSLLPGYKLNAEFMEKMMGVKEKADVTLITAPDTKGKGIQAYLEIISATASILGNLRNVRKQKDEFIRDFDKVYREYAHKDYSNSSIEHIYKDYLDFERMMVTKWKAPLVNDFFAMIYFGLLQKICAKYFPEHADIHNQLVASSKDIITTQPIIRLPQIVARLIQEPELLKAMKERTPSDVWQLLNSGQYHDELKEIQDYLDDWGERCVAELKLETITYTQEPERLVAILQTYIKQGTDSTLRDSHKTGARVDAEQIAASALKGKWLKTKIFNHILKQARYLVSNRENLRYYRTKGFGVVRRMMYSIGSQMEQEGLIGTTRDVYYLTLNDIASVAGGKMAAKEIKKIIEDKKKDYQLFQQLALPERIETYGRQEKIIVAPATQQGKKSLLTELQGIPCCAGIVRGKVCKVSVNNGRFPDNEVLVTYATDPGYVVMFPSSKGILTERGSLLSHAAIVSREMNIPCIVGIDRLMEQLGDGDEIIMDGSTGIVKILHKQAPA